MRSILRRRPSPAMVVALISLFVSLGGVSYGVATGAIDSRELLNETVRSRDIRNNEVRAQDLRNNDVRTRDLRNNDIRAWDIRNNEIQGRDIRANTITRGDIAFDTLTGGSILESSLGTVPSASTVAGLAPRNIRYTSSTTATRRTILDLGGLKLEASCNGDPQVFASTTVSGGAIRFFSVTDSGIAKAGAEIVTSLTAGNEGQVQVSLLRPDGGHVEAILAYAEETGCRIAGHAVAG
jgi:hypothetical protein